MNDGAGRMSPNFFTVGEAVEWARNWYAQAPHLREVVSQLYGEGETKLDEYLSEQVNAAELLK